MTELLYFLLWTLILYLVHRVVHKVPYLRTIHLDHHIYILKKLKINSWSKNPTGWHWNNLFLYNDTVLSTVDLWITEVIPTLVFCLITNQWWIFALYYIWAAFLQETIEHNPKVSWYPFTSGQWHLIHHTNFKKNYGLFHPLWDKIFQTEVKI